MLHIIKRRLIAVSRYEKEAPFFKERYMKGVPFLSKVVYKRVRGWTLVRSLPA